MHKYNKYPCGHRGTGRQASQNQNKQPTNNHHFTQHSNHSGAQYSQSCPHPYYRLWTIQNGHYVQNTIRQAQKRFQNSQISSIFPYICQHSCLHLLLNYNECVGIIRHIENIRFVELRQISLGGNKIQSIESLSRVFMPLLENLLLGINNIVSLKPLHRLSANCPNLQWLNIQQNPIQMGQYQNLSHIFPHNSFKYILMTLKLTQNQLNCQKLPSNYSNQKLHKIHLLSFKWSIKFSPQFNIRNSFFRFEYVKIMTRLIYSKKFNFISEFQQRNNSNQQLIAMILYCIFNYFIIVIICQISILRKRAAEHAGRKEHK